ncbi:hypothetical protein [Sodalis sp.]|uniref:hypothetical protein n=1 Tax=Sodalis sp. (in: enterobacteria) TaxID=1898979 RepID=UPI003873A364
MAGFTSSQLCLHHALVARPTNEAFGLSLTEYSQGSERLMSEIKTYQPQVLTIFKQAYYRRFR